MVLIALEGFDHHGSSDADLDDYLGRKHASAFGTWEAVSGRLGGLAAATNFTSDDIYVQMKDVNTFEVIIGFAIKFREVNANNPDTLIHFLNRTGVSVASFHRGASGDPRLQSANNTIYTTSEKWSPFLWNYFEIRVLSGTNNSNGELELRMNGKTIIDATGVDTFQSTVSRGTANIVVGGSDHFDPIFDDIYVLDTTGSVNNDFLGDIKVEALFPDGAGNTTNFSVTGAASNFTAVSDNPVDDDTSYISSSTVSNKDTYTYDDVSLITSNVKGLVIHTLGKKDGAGDRVIKPVIRSGTTDYDQAEIYLPYGETDEYAFDSQPIDVDPDTAIAWTVSGVNSAEFGVKLTT